MMGKALTGKLSCPVTGLVGHPVVSFDDKALPEQDLVLIQRITFVGANSFCELLASVEKGGNTSNT